MGHCKDFQNYIIFVFFPGISPFDESVLVSVIWSSRVHFAYLGDLQIDPPTVKKVARNWHSRVTIHLTFLDAYF